jgi:hypothetical protein
LALQRGRFPGITAYVFRGRSYFFLRFRGLAEGPRRPSSTAAAAARAILPFVGGGKASGWPTFQSVGFMLGVSRFRLAFFTITTPCDSLSNASGYS